MDVTAITIISGALLAVAGVIGSITALLKELRSWREPRDRKPVDGNTP